GKLGSRLAQNILNADGNVIATRYWTQDQICNPAGTNTRSIKSWVRYNSVVLEKAMPRLKHKVGFIDLAQYGDYRNIPLRNQWAREKIKTWRLGRKVALVSWELGGPDYRSTLPGPNRLRDTTLDLPKRLA